MATRPRVLDEYEAGLYKENNEYYTNRKYGQ